MFSKLKIIALTTIILSLAACGGDDNKIDKYTVYDVIKDSEAHTTLEVAIDEAGLQNALEDNVAITVFAPTDDAFALLGQETIDALLDDPEGLADILTYHVVDEVRYSGSLRSGTIIETLNGNNVAGGSQGGDTYVNLAIVLQADIITDNGVVHVIDTVLLPPSLEPLSTNIVETAVADGRFETLVTALEATSLDAVLADEDGTFTVFAPTDEVFAMLPTGTLTALTNDGQVLNDLLLQHVVSGDAVDSISALGLNGKNVATAGGALIPVEADFNSGMITFGGANVIIEDIVTSNGIIHVIDAVIVGDLDVPQPSIVDVATEVGGFDILLEALERTSLDLVLEDVDTNYTVFAPTDAAFLELGQDAIDDLLAAPDELAEILLYHVIGGQTILSTAAIGVAESDSSTVSTANAAMNPIGLSFVDGTLFVNTAAVGPADVMASNGVIHVLDQVLLPPAAMGTPTMNIAETAIAAGNFTTLVDLLGTANLVGTLSDPSETYTVFAPTDAAFALIPAADLAALGADVPGLTDVLLQHVIQGASVDSVTAFSLNGTSVNTMANEDVTIEIVDGVLEVQGSAVSTYDIYTTNGVIHVIDAVITETLE